MNFQDKISLKELWEWHSKSHTVFIIYEIFLVFNKNVYICLWSCFVEVRKFNLLSKSGMSLLQ